MPARAAEEGGEGVAAVLDVGSNSIRLVLYRLEGRAIWPLFNEKVAAGLGRDLAITGKLSPEGVVDAMAALRRFQAVLGAVRPTSLHAVATAAVRQASDGRAFLDRVRGETGLDVRILSGREEARCSALGVLAGAPDAEGLAADLGGLSLEIVRIGRGRVGRGVTLPLGPFSLAAGRTFEAVQVQKRVDACLKEVEDYAATTLHVVGGSWRRVAQVCMLHHQHPLQIVQQYEVGARDLLEATRFIATESRSSLEKLPGMSRKRAETLPYAAVVLEGLVSRYGIRRVCFSAYGLREGLLYDAMTADLRTRDPLLEGCERLGAGHGLGEPLGPALASWIEPAFGVLDPVFEAPREARLRRAACLLADIGVRLHPDHRAELVFEQVLRAPIAGQTHVERAFLAAAVHARYGGSPSASALKPVRSLLTEPRFTRARAIGLAMRLGSDLAARVPALLVHSRLTVRKDRLVLGARREWVAMLLGEQTARRAAALAQALDLELDLPGG